MNRVALAAFVLALTCAVVSAQQPPGVRVSGTVESFDGRVLTVKSDKLGAVKINLADNTAVFGVMHATPADLKPGAFIGIAGLPQPDGSIAAFSIHMFLPAQRGVVPDRHGPWDAKPNSTMTNAYVEDIVTAKDGETLTVKYKEGEKKIIVSPQTVIAAAAPGSKDELKPGAQIVIFGWDKQADGSVLAKVMYVGRDVVPAM